MVSKIAKFPLKNGPILRYYNLDLGFSAYESHKNVFQLISLPTAFRAIFLFIVLNFELFYQEAYIFSSLSFFQSVQKSRLK